MRYTTSYQMRETKFASKKEKRHFKRLEKELEKNGKPSYGSITNIVSHILNNRQPYDAVIDPETVFYSGLAKWLPCCFGKYKRHKNITDYKRAKLYKNGLKKVKDELDIVKITKQLRLSKVMFRTFK